MQAGETGEPLLPFPGDRLGRFDIAQQKMPADRVVEVRCSGTGLTDTPARMTLTANESTSDDTERSWHSSTCHLTLWRAVMKR